MTHQMLIHLTGVNCAFVSYEIHFLDPGVNKWIKRGFFLEYQVYI